jgi:DNA-binding transcriptional regulator YdaS (Cro superfamily)
MCQRELRLKFLLDGRTYVCKQSYMTDVAPLIDKAISMLGSGPKLAAAAGVSSSSISESKRRNGVGPRVAMGIHKATHGKVSMHDLRPDLWPREDDTPSQAAE